MKSNNETKKYNLKNLFPLVTMKFIPGECTKTIEEIDDFDRRQIAYANYYQQIGDSKEAISRSKPYLEHNDDFLKTSALMNTYFASLSLGDKQGAVDALSSIENLKYDSLVPFDAELFSRVIKSMLFSNDDIALTKEQIDQLPEGIRYYISYFYSLKELTRGRTQEALGIAKSSLMFGAIKYPITAIYLSIIVGASYTFLKDYSQAENYYKQAWDLAIPDGLLSPFVHQSLLVFGFDRKYVKVKYPQEYNYINEMVKRYLSAWGPLTNNINWFDYSEISRIELVIGVLFKHGFSVKEISDLMLISPNTVKTHLKAMREKTGASNRSETLKINIK